MGGTCAWDILAFAGAHKVNGVSALHTDLMKRDGVPRTSQCLFPDRIANKTNGVTPRRWLFEANPGLTASSSRRSEAGCSRMSSNFPGLLRFADDAAFRQSFAASSAATRRDSPGLIAIERA